MSTLYVRFMSDSDTVLSENCTTRWPDTVGCHIPMSGQFTGKYTNLMVMTGDEQEIQDWLLENVGKVIEVAEEEATLIGQTMVPEGTTSEINELVGDTMYIKTYTAGVFTITEGQEWTETGSVEP